MLQRRQDRRCASSAVAPRNVQLGQVPLSCLRIEVLGDNIRWIVEAWDLRHNQVRACPGLILEPHVSDVEVANFPQSLAAKDVRA